MEDLNIFIDPVTKEKLNIESTLLVYRLRDLLNNKPYARLGSASDMTYMLLFGVGAKSQLMLEAVSEYHELAKKYEGYRIGDLV